MIKMINKDDEDYEDYENYEELQFEEFIDPSDQSQLHPITIKKIWDLNERENHGWKTDTLYLMQRMHGNMHFSVNVIGWK